MKDRIKKLCEYVNYIEKFNDELSFDTYMDNDIVNLKIMLETLKSFISNCDMEIDNVIRISEIIDCPVCIVNYDKKENISNKVFDVLCRYANNLCDWINEEISIKYEGNIKKLNNLHGYVYFIRNNDTNEIKIGKTYNVEKRIDVLMSTMFHCGIKNEIEVIATIETFDSGKEEAIAHKFFSKKRRIGEWFDITSEEVKSYIEKNIARIKENDDMIKQGFNVTYPNAVSFVIANRDNIKN